MDGAQVSVFSTRDESLLTSATSPHPMPLEQREIAVCISADVDIHTFYFYDWECLKKNVLRNGKSYAIQSGNY